MTKSQLNKSERVGGAGLGPEDLCMGRGGGTLYGEGGLGPVLGPLHVCLVGEQPNQGMINSHTH